MLPVRHSVQCSAVDDLNTVKVETGWKAQRFCISEKGPSAVVRYVGDDDYALQLPLEEKEPPDSYRDRLRQTRLMWLDEIGRKIHPCHSIVAAFLEPHFNGYETTAAHRIEIPATPCISSSPFRPWAIDCVGTKLSICGSDSSHAHIDGAWMCPSTGVPVGSAALSHDASHRVLSTHSDGIIRIDGECIFNLGVTGQSVAKWIDDSLIAVVTSKGGRCYLIDSSSRYIVADWGNFLYPCDIAVGLKGEQLLIADTLNRRVVEIRPATGSRRIVIEDIYARSLCISDGTGHVMVSDGLTGTIRIFTTDFQELHSWRISLPEASSSIRGLAISEDKCLLVCDSVSSCIWRFPPMWQ